MPFVFVLIVFKKSGWACSFVSKFVYSFVFRFSIPCFFKEIIQEAGENSYRRILNNHGKKFISIPNQTIHNLFSKPKNYILDDQIWNPFIQFLTNVVIRAILVKRNFAFRIVKHGKTDSKQEINWLWDDHCYR